jgi:putative ABC transport system substrate-binding protein
MRRRDFVTLLGSAAGAWPLKARAQNSERIRRVGVLMTLAAHDPIAQVRIKAFVQGLQQLGWNEGSNLQLAIWWDALDPERRRKGVTELVALAPDVIFTTGSTTVGPLLQATRSVSIVFVIVPDPVGAGFVDTLARPGGNATGYLQFEYALSGKWLQLLKEVAPNITRAGVLRDPSLTAAVAQYAAIQSAAPSLSTELMPLNARDASEIERVVVEFARSVNGGLIVTSGPLTAVHRNLIIALTARHKLPAVYYERYFVAAGGLISYGPDFLDQYRRAAGYVDRILKGEKPADLPVQAPTKYQLVINLKTAKALGLEVPPTLLARADEVIE